jgi:predicted aconitase
LRRTAWENFTEVGVHANLGDDCGGLQRLFAAIAKEIAGDAPEYGYRMTRRKKARVFVHGVIHMPVGLPEVERVDAWSRAGARKVAKRDEYFGLLAGKHAAEVEMLLAKMFAKGAVALQELLS